MKRIYLVFGLMLILGMAACSSSSNTESNTEGNSEGEETSTYPEDQIELIIPYSPGGASDMVSRAVGNELEDDLGVPVTPVNKEGATGTVGMTAAKTADADGLYIVFSCFYR